MAKLYAELTSDKGGRVVGKGGNEKMVFTLYEGNSFVFKIVYKRKEHELLLIDDTENMLLKIDGPTQIVELHDNIPE